MQTELIIDNQKRAAHGNAIFERRHPTSGDIVTRAAAGDVADAIAAADSASIAFQSWRHSSPSERRRILLKAADALEARMPDFIEAMAAEVGAAALWAGFNVVLAATAFREAASMTTQIQGETIPTDKPGALSMTVRQPVGVILSIVPWNGPVVLAARAIAYPLMCGNTVVFRASEASPRTHMLVAEALVDAGLPPGVLNFLTNAPQDAPEVIDALIAHKAVRRVNFTGSTRVGRIIAQKAAVHLKRCLLELGGKSPLVVLKDANIDDAVNAAVFGSFLYQGQICMSTERIVVDESIADEFVAKFAARAKELPAGDPMKNPQCVIGPMVSKDSGPRLNSLLEDALAKGAKLACGGRAEGASMPATIVDHVTRDMKIYDEETFGPVTTIVRVNGDQEAATVANDTAYGLSAAVFCKDVMRALNVAMQIDTGACHVNGATVQNEAQAPYGGTKHSGYGRFDGRAVIDEFTELKWITIEPSGQQYPI
ncbi:Acyl-CoA reductase [Variovorax sp. OK605]|jgi:acyl-CoA reductase-like NAD-dependent aldehyde dehydrogenase|uniref:aldehyde dehydrogenase n=1 Tax=unclassified Variovorax TaxID=663243 RepID=UPI0008AD1805|nr:MULTISPECIES: aldehyde dehydrogenase [unclassified Variovorax]SEK13330.1 Acyl-CoA reductase [Variovorax sp. OK202]SFD86221.1 Acyl-CoA reductase [Variovorax sp. OK212]SFO90174.1 Acyl-CoA reductase [Variovorax sp. OK605]